MKKFAITFAMMFICIAVFAKEGNGLLWKVSGGGRQGASYVLGSHHMAPASFVDSISGLREALGEVEAVYGEVTKDELSPALMQQLVMQYSIAPADSTLSVVLTPDQLTALDHLLAAYTGQSGMVAQLEILKPAVVTAQLAQIQLMAAHPDTQIEQPFDAVVMGIAEAAGKEIGGLESAEFQMQMLFGDPISKQAKALVEAMDSNDKQIEQARNLTDAYLAQDLDRLTQITTDPKYGIEADDIDRLIYSRNRTWADELVEILPAKSVLVVVGSGHLGGSQGLLNLLRQRGYTVEAVKN